jgi:hypothetical protein
MRETIASKGKMRARFHVTAPHPAIVTTIAGISFEIVPKGCT